MTLEEFNVFCDVQAKKVKAERLKQEKLERERKLKKLMGHKLTDFDIRKNGDHVESFIKSTGEVVYQHSCEEEAWRDLKEEFGDN